MRWRNESDRGWMAARTSCGDSSEHKSKNEALENVDGAGREEYPSFTDTPRFRLHRRPWPSRAGA